MLVASLGMAALGAGPALAQHTVKPAPMAPMQVKPITKAVPDVLGKTLSEAQKMLKKAGFNKVEIKGTMAKDVRIQAQRPKGGERVPLNAKVILKTTSGKRGPATVRPRAGKPSRTARPPMMQRPGVGTSPKAARKSAEAASKRWDPGDYSPSSSAVKRKSAKKPGEVIIVGSKLKAESVPSDQQTGKGGFVPRKAGEFRDQGRQELPDLVVTDLTVNDQCRPVVTLRNAGTAPLWPAYDYTASIGVQFYKDSSAFGGWGIGAADVEALRLPGGTLTKTFPPFIEGTMNITVIVDQENKVAEIDEANNTSTRTLECNPPFPDLAIQKISFTTDCRAKIKLANIGDGPIPSGPGSMYEPFRGSCYNAVMERFLDGEADGCRSFDRIDPDRRLRTPGGVVEWEDWAKYRAAREVSYELNVKDLIPPFREKNYNVSNNSMSAQIPRRCMPDLAVTRIAVDEDCKIFVTVKNLGPGPLPRSAFRISKTGWVLDLTNISFQMSLNNKGFGGWLLGKNTVLSLENPGGSATVKPRTKLPQTAGASAGTSSILGAWIDSNGFVAETNESNNQLILNNAKCPSTVTIKDTFGPIDPVMLKEEKKPTSKEKRNLNVPIK